MPQPGTATLITHPLHQFWLKTHGQTRSAAVGIGNFLRGAVARCGCSCWGVLVGMVESISPSASPGEGCTDTQEPWVVFRGQKPSG